MRVFITGATGFVGSAVVDELVHAGHQVTGLTRSDVGATQLMNTGARVHRGALEDLDSLRRGAAEAEAVLHLAFHHDFDNFGVGCELDRAAIEAIGGVLAGSNRALIVSSGVLGLAEGRPGTEEDSPHHGFPRKSEETGLAFAAKGVRAMVIRLSPTVHGKGDHGFVPALIAGARKNGFSAYAGDGKNRWPAVHRVDAARLYRLALEKGVAGGRYHGVAEQGVAMRDIADAIGRRLGVPSVSKSAEEVVETLGFIGRIAAMDATCSSDRTQRELGWGPTAPGLLADLANGAYFA